MKNCQIIQLALVLLFALLSSCSSTSNDGKTGVELLTWISSADPEQDAVKALETGDRRFKGVHMYSSYPPGIASVCYEISGINYIAGTSDSFESEEHGALVLQTVDYAATYNHLILRSVAPDRFAECAEK